MKNILKPRCTRSRVSAICLGLWCLSVAVLAHAGDPLIFAAASLKNALDSVIEQFQTEQNIAVKVSYSSSGTLARQLEQGAPADIFISANPIWMDYLQERKLIDSATRVDLLGNNLVLITSKDSNAPKFKIVAGFDLVAVLGDGRLAIGDPLHVPAGIYTKAALENLHVWQPLASKLARADNVRSALALVARGEAPLGIVYSSDAVVEADVGVVAEFPEDSHPPIVYPAALVADRDTPQAALFLTFLQSPIAGKIFQRYGLRTLN